MRGMGYEVKINVKHIAVCPPGKERFTRLRRLGEDYTEEAIRRRIQENGKIPLYFANASGHLAQNRRRRYRGSWS